MRTSRRLKRVYVWALFFIIILAATVCIAEPLISGDFDEDKIVSFGDLQILADDWLDSSTVADMDGSGMVTFNDFALFANNWQKSVPVLVINEFMAENNINYADPQGDFDDWIEIYNTTNSSINLGGMYITDNLSDITKYRIPTGFPSQTTVPAHGFLILWADEDMTDGAVHLGIKLSADGEDIALSAADGVTVIDSLTFGNQLPDISYGSYPDGSSSRRYFGIPTPGAANNEGYLGIAPEPEFSRSSGIFTDNFQLTISVDSNTAVIRYTTDHSVPTGSSPVYTGPITIYSTKEIIARSFEPGFADSEIEGKNFVKVDSEVAGFSSNIPVVILDSFGYNIDAEHSATEEYPYRNVYAVVIDTNDAGRATVTDEPDSKSRGGMRVRGQTSAGFPKKQYKFESWDYMSDDKDVSFLGMPEDSDWIIHGPYSDKSLIRNHLTYRLARDMGNYAVRTELCEVFNNQNDGEVTYGDYAGVYVFMERIKIGGERLQSEKLEPTDNALPEISGGYIIKQDKWDVDPPPADEYFNTAVYYKHLQYDEPTKDELTQTQKDWIKNYCNQTEYALSGSNFADPINGYQKYLDPDKFVDYHIMVEISRNVDGYGLSDYMFKPRNGRIQRGPVWDYNLAWGNADYGDGWLTEGWRYTPKLNPDPSSWGRGSYAWFQRLFEDDNFYIRYIDRWFALREGIFKNENILSRYDGYVDMLQEAQERNFQRWNILGVDLWPNWFVGETYEEETDWLRNWIYERFKWINEQFRKPPRYNQDGGQIDSSFGLTIAPASAPYVYKFVDYDDNWSYLDDGSNQGTDWTILGFLGHDSWPVNSAQFGFGDGDETTVVDYGPDSNNKYITTYFRKIFNVDELEKVQTLTANLLRDDGAAIWLNGVELARDNIIEGRLLYTTLAASEVEGVDESTYYSHSIDPNYLLEGENILAVEVHLSSADNEDMSFDCELEGLIGFATTPGTVYYTTDGNDPRLHGGAVNPAANIYTTPISFSKSTQVKARELDSGEWTALNEATFSVGPVKDSLRITEIMYHSIDP
ncbi:MAG: CotH kinase family protein, partial [Planctomycetes bacterium]|nr:CotH kinase family protein [Planctomycetota bacterium]